MCPYATSPQVPHDTKQITVQFKHHKCNLETDPELIIWCTTHCPYNSDMSLKADASNIKLLTDL